jgi:purine-binding chemotaxis protein CheW
MSLQTTMLDSLQIITFDFIDGQKRKHFAIPVEQVREIRKIELITNIPNTKPFVVGIINLRGQLIPIIDIKQKIGLSKNVNDVSKQQVLIIEFNKQLLGLLIDEVNEVLRIQMTEIQQSPENMFDSENYIKGIIKINDKLVILLDLTKIT